MVVVRQRPGDGRPLEAEHADQQQRGADDHPVQRARHGDPDAAQRPHHVAHEATLLTGRASLRFYEELNDFLPPARRKVDFELEIDRSRSVKDAIESTGVPHTEVDLILVDGVSVGFEHLLTGGERVAVYPMFEALDIS